MSSIIRIDEYPDVDKYWRLVEESLKRIFGAPYDRLERVRGWVRERSEEEQLLFYHAEPLDVAADIAQKRPDANAIDRYLNIARELEWFTTYADFSVM